VFFVGEGKIFASAGIERLETRTRHHENPTRHLPDGDQDEGRADTAVGQGRTDLGKFEFEANFVLML
jgi:hypothetical protein